MVTWKSFVLFHFYRMECDQVKEKLEDTNVTDKEVTLKSDRTVQYKTMASAMLPIHI